MSSARCAGGVSAALVAAGLLLAGPQALGVAAAEERDAAGATDTAGKPSPGAEQSSSQREARAAARRAAPTTRSRVTTDPTGEAASGGRAHRPAAAAAQRSLPYALTAPRRAAVDIPQGAGAGTTTVVEPTLVVPQWDTAASDPAGADSVGAAPAVPAVTARIPGPAGASPAAVATALSAVTARIPASPPVAGAIVSLPFTAERLLDTFGARLSGLPGRIGDLLSGALWLVRRSLFPVGANVGTWGTAACVATKDCSGQDLSGADLSGQDLTGVAFVGTNLSKANLYQANLTGAPLGQAILTGALLNSTTLSGAQMSGAVLSKASAVFATLDAADLTNAILTGAVFRYSTFIGADLTGADLTLAELSSADFSDANLTGAKLPYYSNLSSARWSETTCPRGNKSSTGCAAIVPLEITATADPFLSRLRTDRARYWPRATVPEPLSANKEAWIKVLTNYPDTQLRTPDGVLARIANNSTDPVLLRVKDSQSYQFVALPVGAMVWTAGYDDLEVEVHSTNGAGWGRLVFDDPTVGYPSAGIRYYNHSPNDNYSVDEQIYYYAPASDVPVALGATVRRLQDPQDWIEEEDRRQLSLIWDRPNMIDDWAVFSISIDQMAPR